MNFETSLDTALEALSPAAARRLRRRSQRRHNRLRQPVTPPSQGQEPEKQDDAPEVLQDIPRLPQELRGRYQEIKQDIENNLGIILRIRPDLKDNIFSAMNVLFRGVTSHIGEDDAQQQNLEVAWLRVLKGIDAIAQLIGGDRRFAALRKNLRTFRDYLRSTVGASLYK